VGGHTGASAWHGCCQDGFVALEAVRGIATMLTRPFRMTGIQLELNAQCDPDGFIRLEILDSKENSIPGYTSADMDLFQEIPFGIRSHGKASRCESPVRPDCTVAIHHE